MVWDCGLDSTHDRNQWCQLTGLNIVMKLLGPHLLGDFLTGFNGLQPLSKGVCWTEAFRNFKIYENQKRLYHCSVSQTKLRTSEPPSENKFLCDDVDLAMG